MPAWPCAPPAREGRPPGFPRKARRRLPFCWSAPNPWSWRPAKLCYPGHVTIRVHADFFEDVRVQLIDLLDSGGFVVPREIAASVEEVCRLYFNVRWRLLSRTPRRVHRSAELT